MDTPVKITNENFELAFDQVKTAHFMLGLFDWGQLVEARRAADSIMHITDPTRYRALINSKNAEINFEVAAACDAFVKSISVAMEKARAA